VSWLQAVNPFFIVLLGIPFAWMWASLGRANRDPSSPLKFSLGIIQLALGFVAMVFAAKAAANGGKAPLFWLVLAYFLHTTGELCLSPVGLSTVTKMSPVRLVGLMMGLWFLSNAFAGVLSGVIAKATTGEAGYGEVFQNVVYFALAAGGLLLVLTPLLKKLGPEGKQNATAK
jgi:POT family proton-dependent oligopeptide transporter